MANVALVARRGLLFTVGFACSVMAAPTGTAFTYQGQLKQSGGVVNDTCDFQFSLWNALTTPSGTQVGSDLMFAGGQAIEVINGLFTAQLDFGAVPFDGNGRWLQIAVRCPTWHGQGTQPPYTTLDPRQPITIAPYAMYALQGPGGSSSWQASGATIHNTNVGNVGVGETSPLSRLHVQTTDLSLQASALLNEDILIEDADAVLGLYSSSGGTYGSAISLGEVDATGLLLNKWAITRNTTTGGSRLMFSFSANANYQPAPTFLTIDGTGLVGIGTTSPAFKLDVVGTSASARVSNFTNNGAQLVLKGTGSGASYWLGSLDFTDGTDVRQGGMYYSRSFVGDFLVLTAGQTENVYLSQSGNLGIGGIPNTRLQVDGGTDASLTAHGYLILGSTIGTNLVMDDNEIIARNDGGASDLGLNVGSGNVGVGTLFPNNRLSVSGSADVTGSLGIRTATPVAPLQVVGGADASLAGGGFAVIGSTTSTNVVFDNNEIMARNNGSEATLFLNADGGDVVVGGALDIGYEIVSSNVEGDFPCCITVTCPSGKKALGGGCSLLGGSTIFGNHPVGDNAWECGWDDVSQYNSAYVICARVK